MAGPGVCSPPGKCASGPLLQEQASDLRVEEYVGTPYHRLLLLPPTASAPLSWGRFFDTRDNENPVHRELQTGRVWDLILWLSLGALATA
jgi:hypothetical protein